MRVNQWKRARVLPVLTAAGYLCVPVYLLAQTVQRFLVLPVVGLVDIISCAAVSAGIQGFYPNSIFFGK